ncbi:hypothetical protein RCL_jg6654.t1 [Rhizophagus clarus]|uniref:Uncharacterized protein n=2 Tax=Rhizophagus clarus TaxID=94130 RepID=A0A8H3QN83_9GLOM|nr:hypothetical protein RCL_jg6654.t1 [Rhizophagus clarus]
MFSPTSNPTANFIKSALYKEYYECFDAVVTSSNWSLSHLSLFAKDVGKDEYQLQMTGLFKNDLQLKQYLDDMASYKGFNASQIILWKWKFLKMMNTNQISSNSNQNEEGTSWRKDKHKAEFVKQVDYTTATTTPVPDLVILQPVVMLTLSSSSTLKPDAKFFEPKIKKVKSKESDPDATHIITGYHPNPSLRQYVRDILVYDISAKWDNVELLEHLKV